MGMRNGFFAVVLLDHCFPVDLKFRMLVFIGEGKPEDLEKTHGTGTRTRTRTRTKTKTRTRTADKITSHVRPGLEVKPGP